MNGIVYVLDKFGQWQAKGKAQQNYDTSQDQAAKLLEAHQKGILSAEEYAAKIRGLGSTSGLNREQSNYGSTQNENRGTAGENPLISNLIGNATNRQQFQQQSADELSNALAANPLRQYNLDTDLKRQMAANNQQNLANNVRDQLSQLGAARSVNADMIKNALQGGGAGLSNTSFGTAR